MSVDTLQTDTANTPTLPDNERDNRLNRAMENNKETIFDQTNDATEGVAEQVMTADVSNPDSELTQPITSAGTVQPSPFEEDLELEKSVEGRIKTVDQKRSTNSVKHTKKTFFYER